VKSISLGFRLYVTRARLEGSLRRAAIGPLRGMVCSEEFLRKRTRRGRRAMVRAAMARVCAIDIHRLAISGVRGRASKKGPRNFDATLVRGYETHIEALSKSCA
jgi:hypothetical protein